MPIDDFAINSASALYLTKTSASTTYATKTELANVDLSSASAAAVAAIVDSAPSTLNTLNELAAALNDDANFSSTVTTSLGNKLDVSTASATYLTQLSASTTYAAKSGETFSGNITAPEVRASTKIVAQTVGGDEGGEILLGKAATNTTLTGDGVTIDVWQNRLRIFEQGGDARGGYIDVSTLGNGVATDLTPGINLVKTQTIGTSVTSVTVTNAFSSTYDNYRILISGVDCTVTTNTRIQFGSATSAYYGSQLYDSYGGGATGTDRTNNGSSLIIGVTGVADNTYTSLDVHAPNLAKITAVSGTYYGGGYSGWFGGEQNSTTQFTGFTILPGTGTFTGGTISVYGYRK